MEIGGRVALPTKRTRSEEAVSDRGDHRTSDGSTTAELAFDAEVQAQPERARAAVDELRRLLAARSIHFGGSPLPTSIKPHFLHRAENDEWVGLLSKLLTIMEETADHLSHDPEFRRNGPFAPDAWELLDIDPGYSKVAVVCRPDVVWNSGSIGLLEMNADSPAMMLYADVLQEIQRELFPLNGIDRDGLLTFERRIPALRDALVATYREWGGTQSSPVIAIIDWPNQKTSSEQEQLARTFTELGCPSFTCSPDQLELRGSRLYGRGEPIDIVQRRLLFPDIVKRRDELRPLLTAYRERHVCVINPLRSYLVGCKAILAELCRRERANTLSSEERMVVNRVVPCTGLPGEIDEADLLDRSKWVIKPIFGSGGTGVVIGRYTDHVAWQQALQAGRQGRWIIQTFLPIPLYRVPLTSASGHAIIPLYANWNPFFFGGTAAGGIARVSSDPVVGISARGALLPTVLVNDE